MSTEQNIDWMSHTEALERLPARELLQWALETFQPRIALACSF